jgi:hypothetical protein
MAEPYPTVFFLEWFDRPSGAAGLARRLLRPRVASAAADFTLGYCRELPPGAIPSTGHVEFVTLCVDPIKAVAWRTA